MASAQRGVSLLEGLLVLTLVLVLMVVGIRQMAQISKPAERAAVQGMLGQLNAQVRFKVAKALINNQRADLAQWQGANPFKMLPEQGMVQPDMMQRLRNLLVARAGYYCGELAVGQQAEAGCWYYLPDQQQIRYYHRWPQQAQYHSYQLQVSRNAQGRVRSLVLRPLDQIN